MKWTRRSLLASVAATALLACSPRTEAYVASGIASGPVTLQTVTTFDAQNFSGSTSPGYIRVGLPFKKGHIPSGTVPQIQIGSSVISAQFDQRVTWSDGSLAFAVCHLRDTTFSANETRTYTVKMKLGSFDNTGTKALSDITGAHTWQVKFASTTQYNGTTTVARGSGAFTADFNTHAGVATRVTKIHSGSVCESWVVWGMATDDTGGAADAHLKTDWYVSIWKDGSGNIADFEYCAIVEQDWWDVASKFRLNYDATLKDSATTIATYSGVQHPYRSHWATVRTTADDNQGRRFWVTAIPTLIYKPSKTYWISTNYVPPLDTTFAPSSNTVAGYTANYVPCSAENHRAQVDSTGGYAGRGMMSNMDCISFLRQTSTDYKCSRVNAFAGLHIPYHYRSAQNRTRPSEGADVANTTVPMKFRPYSAATYDWTAVGMPAGIDPYVGNGVNDFPSTYVNTTGGLGVWTTSIDASHAVPYSYFMYLLEGEWHFMQATLELATNVVHQQNGNGFAGCPVFLYRNVAPWQTMFSIPATQYSGIGSMRNSSNPRMTGWALNLFADAYAVVPDSDVQSAFIKFMNNAQSQFLADNIPYFPPEQAALGSWVNTVSLELLDAPWQQNFNALGAFMNWRLTESANALTFLQTIVGNQSVSQWNVGLPYRSAHYHSTLVLNPSGTFSGPWLTPGTWLGVSEGITFSGGTASNGFNYCRPQDGQVCYFQNDNGATLPSGVTTGTPYYMVNSNYAANTFKVATTLGGSPIAVGDATSVSIGAVWATQSTNPANLSPYLPNADDYSPIARAAIVAAYLASVNGATLSIVNAAQTWMAPVDSGGTGFATWATWRWVAP